VLAVATKELTGKAKFAPRSTSANSYSEGTSRFSTRPRTPQPARLRALHKHGVAVKNPYWGLMILSAAKCAKTLASQPIPLLLGGDVEKMSDAELAEAADKAALFARLSPAH